MRERLPLAAMRAAAPAGDDGPVRMRCVIVDDDEAFLGVARALLERDGVIVAGVAHSGTEAVERAQALQPDVVLIDIRLGEESGFEAAGRLAESGQAATMVMISTHVGEDYADLIAESPAVGFIAKADLSAAALRRILGAD